MPTTRTLPELVSRIRELCEHARRLIESSTSPDSDTSTREVWVKFNSEILELGIYYIAPEEIVQQLCLVHPAKTVRKTLEALEENLVTLVDISSRLVQSLDEQKRSLESPIFRKVTLPTRGGRGTDRSCSE